MASIKGIIIDSTTGLPITGVNVVEILQPKNNPKKILGREFEILTNTDPYTLKIQNKKETNTDPSTPTNPTFTSLQMSALGSKLNPTAIEPVVEKKDDGKTLIKGYNFTFKNGNQRLIDVDNIKLIIDFVDDKTQTQFSKSGLVITKI
jgi:hypothetical protein